MWSAATHDDGYTITSKDELIEVSLLVERPSEIEVKRKLMVAAIDLIKSGSLSLADHSKVSLPPISFGQR